MNPSICKLRPVLLEGSLGPLVAFYHPPADGVVPRGDVLMAPAFAEEMNRCRSMVTMQAQALAAMGMGTLVLDMGGTGDSAGEFEQADWNAWRTDLQLGIAWLRQHGNGCSTVWGVRLGALMAVQLAAQDNGIRQLMLWMPVMAAKTYWTQFLRIRIAADMSMANRVKSTDDLRHQSASGQVVESSGYRVGPALAQQLDLLELPDGKPLSGCQVAWFEVVTTPESPMPRANLKLADEWRSNGVAVITEKIVGPQFWQVHQRDEAPMLIRASSEAAGAWNATPALNHGASTAAAAVVSIDATVATEYPTVWRCGNSELAGLIHRGKPGARTGVVIVVAGGPQYRVGAHRQFVSLARMFATNGYPVMRFDLRGMGDSSGKYLGYEHSRPDIRAAVDEFMQREPSLDGVALLGECESASGILFYASQDARVRQIALINPWVRTSEGQAQVIIKHYYLDRVMSREFWRKISQGQFDVRQAAASFVDVLTRYLSGRKARRTTSVTAEQDDFDHLPLPSRTAEGLRRFRGPVMFLMSGRDLIAREFDEVTKSSPAWQGLLAGPHIRRKDIAGADHTFSKPEAKAEAQKTLLDWLSGTAPVTDS
jgi:exosortase A-associated hydrolase 1/exosortase A-associated hydrolase 2